MRQSANNPRVAITADCAPSSVVRSLRSLSHSLTACSLLSLSLPSPIQSVVKFPGPVLSVRPSVGFLSYRNSEGHNKQRKCDVLFGRATERCSRAAADLVFSIYWISRSVSSPLPSSFLKFTYALSWSSSKVCQRNIGDNWYMIKNELQVIWF